MHTEENSHERRSFQKFIQHPEIHCFNFIFQFSVVIIYQPLQYRIFILQISIIGQGIAISKVDQSWESFNSIPAKFVKVFAWISFMVLLPFGKLWVFQLNHLNSIHITIVINIFKFNNYLVTSSTVLLVCKIQ